MNRCTFHMLQICVLVLTLLMMFFSGPYFLISYYSVWDGDIQYDGPTTQEITSGEFLLSMKNTVTLKSESLDLAIQFGFVVPLNGSAGAAGPGSSNTTTTANNTNSTGSVPVPPRGLCPPFFVPSVIFHGYCQQIRQQELSFLALSPQYDDLTPGGSTFAESPENIVYGNFDFAPASLVTNVTLIAEIVQFERSSSRCKTNEDCYQFAEYLESSSYDLPYNYSTIRCYGAKDPETRDWQITGCGVNVIIGNSTNCFSSSHVVCDFASFYSMFIQPPKIFTAFGIWNWGVIAFISGVFLLVFLLLMQGYHLYKMYLRNFYFFTNQMALLQGVRYDYKLVLSASQFSESDGELRFLQPGGFVLHSHKLAAVFPEADIEGEKQSTLIIRGKFKPTAFYETIYFEVHWDNEFQEADAEVPDVQVTVCRRIPKLVKTRWNLVFCPLFFIYGLFTGSHTPKRLLHYPRFLVLVGYYVLLHLIWIVAVLFTFLSLVPYDPESQIVTMFWGSILVRPVMPIVFMAIFEAILVGVVLSSLVCALPYSAHNVQGANKYQRPSRQLASSFSLYPSIEGEPEMTPSGIDELAICQPDTGVIDQEYTQAVDYSSIEFVPLAKIERHPTGGSTEEEDAREGRLGGGDIRDDEIEVDIETCVEFEIDRYQGLGGESAAQSPSSKTPPDFPTFGTEEYWNRGQS